MSLLLQFQELNVTGSSRVTDEGIFNLIGSPEKLNDCCRNLKFVKLRSTGVRIPGIRHLLRYAAALEGIRCSAYDVLQALAAHFKKLSSLGSRECLPLKYLDFSNCFGILHKYLYLLQNLVEVRIGADAPPQARQKKPDDVIFDYKLTGDSFTASEGALCDLPHLVNLKYKNDQLWLCTPYGNCCFTEKKTQLTTQFDWIQLLLRFSCFFPKKINE